MLRKIKIPSMRQTKKLLEPAKRIIIFYVNGFSGIMRKFLFRMFAPSDIFFLGAKFHREFFLKRQPFFKKFLPVVLRVNEIFYFHLLEFAQTKNKIAGNNLIAECFAD